MRTLLFTALFAISTISGFCSLVYQVVWERILKYTFGGDLVSSVIITATFLFGLGIGAYLFGIGTRHPVRIYALVEFGIGLYGLASYTILTSVAPMIGQVLLGLTSSLLLFRIATLIFCIILLLPVCILMGGTFPLLVRSQRVFGFESHRFMHWLYGFNILGACLAILGVPFFFLSHMTLSATVRLVAYINLGLSVLLGGISFIAFQRNEEPAIHPVDGRNNRAAYIIGFFTGVFSITAEILFFRVSSVFWPSSAYNFPFALAAFLLALSIGSMLFGRSFSSKQRYYRHIAFLLFFTSIALLLSVVVRSGMLFREDAVFLFAEYFLFTGPFAIAIGGIFPTLLHFVTPPTSSTLRPIGILWLTNAVGSATGAILVQFVGLKFFSSYSVCMVTYGTLLILSFSLFIMSAKIKNKTIGFIIASIALPFFIQQSQWNTFRFGDAHPSDAVEGESGIVTIDWNAAKTEGAVKVNGQYMSYLPDHPKHILLAIYPLTRLHRKRILVLGLGGGGMVRELSKDPLIEAIDVVDLSLELPRILSKNPANTILGGVLGKSKVHMYSLDARVAVRLFKPETYDVIIDNLAVLHWAGATGIKSTQYFAQVSRILSQDGTYVLDVNPDTPDHYAAIISALSYNFPVLSTHYWSIALASKHGSQVDWNAVDTVLHARETEPSLNIIPGSYRPWMESGLTEIDRNTAQKTAPVDDDEPKYEYFIHSRYFRTP